MTAKTTAKKKAPAKKAAPKSAAKNPVSLNKIPSDFGTQAVLHDFLNTQKMATGNYNTFAGECMHTDLRSDVLRILEEEHAIQNDIFEEMKERGFYPIKDAGKQMVTQAKKKFEPK